MRRFLFCTAILLAAASAFGADPRISLSAPGPFRAGDSLTVRWEGLPEEVDEFEVLLIRGDRKVELIRLTPQLIPLMRQFQWTVPPLPSADAVLRLRVGIHGEEIDIAQSQPFTIHGQETIERLEFRQGEWWEAAPREPWRDPPARASGFRYETSPERSFAVPPRELALNHTGQIALSLPAGEQPEISTSHQTLSRAPRVIPQRK